MCLRSLRLGIPRLVALSVYRILDIQNSARSTSRHGSGPGTAVRRTIPESKASAHFPYISVLGRWRDDPPEQTAIVQQIVVEDVAAVDRAFIHLPVVNNNV
jgi:hypothetical protein